MVWAANGNGLPPSRDWFGGYTFVREGVVKHVGGTFDGLEVNCPPEDIRAPIPRVTFKLELSNKIARGEAVGNLYGVGRYVDNRRTFYALDPQTSRDIAQAFADKWNAIAACPFLNGGTCACGNPGTTHGEVLLRHPPKGSQS